MLSSHRAKKIVRPVDFEVQTMDHPYKTLGRDLLPLPWVIIIILVVFLLFVVRWVAH